VSVPAAAVNGTVHERPLETVVHSVDVAEMSENVAVAPLTAIPTEDADGETYCALRRVELDDTAGISKTALPLELAGVPAAAERPGAVAFPPQPATAQAATTTGTTVERFIPQIVPR
jgi:hypothetical protein